LHEPFGNRSTKNFISRFSRCGVAPNKFLAKIASDWQKSDGLFVIQPEEVVTFLTPLLVRRMPGVGKVLGKRLEGIGVKAVGDLLELESAMLEECFGR
jgi:DNA polymerase-4